MPNPGLDLGQVLSCWVDVQVERNLHDAMGVARNVVRDPRLVPGGGAVEMALSRQLSERSSAVLVSFMGCPCLWPTSTHASPRRHSTVMMALR